MDPVNVVQNDSGVNPALPMPEYRPVNDNDEMFEAARAWRDRGYNVVPRNPPSEAVKHPSVKWKKWQTKRIPERTFRSWHEDGKFAHGFGFITGWIEALGDGKVVVDVDGEEGKAVIAKYERAHGSLPRTLIVLSGSARGPHYYFNHPGGGGRIKTKPYASIRVDVKGDGGFAVLPPSLHKSGRRYEVIVDAPPADLPPNLIEFIEAEAASAEAEAKAAAAREVDEVAAAFEALGEAQTQADVDRRLAEMAYPDDVNDTQLYAVRALASCGMDEAAAVDKILKATQEIAPADWDLGQEEKKLRSLWRDWANKVKAREEANGGKKPRSLYAAALNAIAKLGLTCRHDVFHDRKIVEGDLQENLGPELSDAIGRAVREAIIRSFKFDPKKENVAEALERMCEKNRFDPVCDYLDSLEWDGKPRIDTWLMTYLGADDTPLNRAFGRKTLVAAVRRAREPGCKFDTMLILEGTQGQGKSKVLKELAGGDQNFSDAKIEWHNAQQQQETVAGVWIYEVSELDGLRKADVSSVKRFLSSVNDRGRPAYGRFVVNRPRRCVFIGTLNPTNGAGYLTDDTGNRRFWPVLVQCADHEGVSRDRDQLWAEAAAAETAGEPIEIAPSLYEAAKAEQEKRRACDPWEDILEPALDNADRAGTEELLSHHLNLTAAQMTKAMSSRLAAVMKHLGWDGPKPIRFVGLDGKDKRARGYMRLPVRAPGPASNLTKRPLPEKQRIPFRRTIS